MYAIQFSWKLTPFWLAVNVECKTVTECSTEIRAASYRQSRWLIGPRLWGGASITVTSPIRQSTSQDGQQNTILIVHSLDTIRLWLNQLMLLFQSGSRLLNVCVTSASFKAKYARKEVQLLMQVWVVNVIICFGVIAMCSKYKLVLSISIISGQIIHWFITSLKECKRCCYALNLRVYSEWPRRELTCKIAKKN